MEKQVINLRKEELEEFNERLDEFMRQAQGIKSTIEILQDKEAMEVIRESEELEKRGIKPVRIDV